MRASLDTNLKEEAAFKIFQENAHENKLLYGTGDLGEVYAISLAQTIGTYSLVTDDTKQGGPYMSLLQCEDDIMPFNFADVLILRYLFGKANEFETVQDFNKINSSSNLNWSFRSQVAKFIRRFWSAPYRNEDKKWIEKQIDKHNIKIKPKLTSLSKLI